MPSQESEIFLLLETAAGFILLHIKEWDAVAQELSSVQDALLDPSKFSHVVEVTAVHPFINAEAALLSCQAIAAGESTEALRTFLEQNLPKKKKKFQLGVLDPSLGKHLAQFGFPIMYDKNILELTRACRFHMKRLMKQFGETELMKFQIGLGHSYSRTKISTDPHRQDKPVQNAVALVENLDKIINTFAMRVREWYSWHFPELSNIVTDQIKFAQAARLIGIKENFEDDRVPELIELLDGDENMAQEVMTARGISMGQDIVEIDMFNIEKFADQLICLAEQRKNLTQYLSDKLNVVAPNLQALVGDVLAAKLISHAGSLTNLAKYPASTVQILGAEKALFRALKTKGNTPKYGLLFQSGFIGKAAVKNKGRISRYLANKCSLASRIDNFATTPCNVFGTKMRGQVEARMNYLADGVATKKNLDVMRDAVTEYDEQVKQIEKAKRKEEKKKRKALGEDAAEAVEEGIEVVDEAPKKKKKRSHSADVEDGSGLSKKKKKKLE